MAKEKHNRPEGLDHTRSQIKWLLVSSKAHSVVTSLLGEKALLIPDRLLAMS